VRPVRRPTAGFTLIEAVIALAVMSLLIGVGMPRMSDWLLQRKAAAAAQFYKEGLQLARAQAVAHNSASRLVLVENASNGQMDWQVDICFPTSGVPCDDDSGAWSTVGAPAGADPDQTRGFRSVLRSSAALPASNVMAQTLEPSGASEVYFTALGWVNPSIATHLTRIKLAPAMGRGTPFPSQTVALTLSGIASICNADAALHDSRRCPP
jgi:type IV fimbrial biogenesis protein FimT